MNVGAAVDDYYGDLHRRMGVKASKIYKTKRRRLFSMLAY